MNPAAFSQAVSTQGVRYAAPTADGDAWQALVREVMI
jgi:hypothetical protein